MEIIRLEPVPWVDCSERPMARNEATLSRRKVQRPGTVGKDADSPHQHGDRGGLDPGSPDLPTHRKCGEGESRLPRPRRQGSHRLENRHGRHDLWLSHRLPDFRRLSSTGHRPSRARLPGRRGQRAPRCLVRLWGRSTPMPVSTCPMCKAHTITPCGSRIRRRLLVSPQTAALLLTFSTPTPNRLVS